MNEKKIMNTKGIALVIVLLFVGMSVIPIGRSLAIEQHIIYDTKLPPGIRNYDRTTLYVGGNGPGNYSSIQEAIDDASNGDTVFVYDDSSPYYENVVVNKRIALLGENKDTTVIDGSGTGAVIDVNVHEVTISRFTITHTSHNGIVVNSDYNIITGNIITDTDWAIDLEYSSNNMISENTIRNTNDGIVLGYSCNNNIIQGNTITNIGFIGIYVATVFSSSSTNNSILGNIIDNNDNSGIYILASNSGSVNDTIVSENTITNSRISGIQIISLFSSDITNTVLSKNMIQNSRFGIYIESKESSFNPNTIISQNAITETKYGIYMRTTLPPAGNTATIYENLLMNNNEYGIYLKGIDNSILVYYNTVIGNIQHAYDNGVTNQWNDSYPLGGNYWDDFDEPGEGAYDDYQGEFQDVEGSDGIVDLGPPTGGLNPYSISGGNSKDWYPLITPPYLFAFANGPYEGEVDEPVEFTGNAIGGSPPYSWHWDFGDGDTSDLQNPSHIYSVSDTYTVTLTVTDSANPSNEATDTTIAIIMEEEDVTPPITRVIKPENALYIRNKKIIPVRSPVIIGYIEIEVEATDDQTGIDRIELYIDDELKTTFTEEPPYSWTWDERVFFKHTIKTIAYDNAGNSASDEISVRKFF